MTELNGPNRVSRLLEKLCAGKTDDEKAALLEQAAEARTKAKLRLQDDWSVASYPKWLEKTLTTLRLMSESAIEKARTTAKRYENDQTSVTVAFSAGAAVVLPYKYSDLEIAALQDELETLDENPDELGVNSGELSLPLATHQRVVQKLAR